MTDAVQVSTTFDSEQSAQSVAATLVNERLAACVQVVGPIRSTYRWEGRVETATEWLCLAKTTAGVLDRLVERIREIHSYAQPEILATPVVAGDAGYLAWLRSEVMS